MKLLTFPNILTLLNLLCGSIAVGLLVSLPVSLSAFPVLVLLCLSLIFDFFDGMAARFFKTNSELGIQLDSLADVVSFGLLPGFMMFKLLEGDIFLSYINSYFSGSIYEEFVYYNSADSHFLALGICFIGLLITLFSALRLAKFNIDTEQRINFKGLNTPATTMFVFSLFWIKSEKGFIFSEVYDIYILIPITFLLCYLLISNIPMFSLKFKNFSWKDNYFKYIFLIISLILFAVLNIKSLAIIITLYVLTSILFKKKIVE